MTAALLCVPDLVQAHSPMQGIGDFYAGVLHPLLVPAHALALVMLGLFSGQGGLYAMRSCYLGFLPALVVGLTLAGTGLDLGDGLEPLLLLLAALTGMLVILQFSPPHPLFAAAGAAVGLLLGLDSAPEAVAPGPIAAALLGASLGAFACLLLIADLCERARHHWQQVAVRVIGSWGTASATLVFALGWLRPD
ncbi:MAG: HupE/UreJ family protein [Haliea sp.]|uniref:HupE/UreJ family protein n=1 Tax=Haliea sp. TaxID=1932666 RepID=UPI0032ECDEAA